MESIQIAGITDTGQRRNDNQDTYICERLDSSKWPTQGLALLAAIDGVGGYMGGDIAAEIARDYITQYMMEPKGDLLSMLREAVVNANNAINDARKQDLKLSHMCCVLTVAVADPKNQKLYYAHVGDTRLYRFRQGELTKLTKDHSIVGLREDAQDITEEEAMQHSRRNEILRDVGSIRHQIDDQNFYDAEEADFQPGDVLLLCSDGLTDMITQSQIVKVLQTYLPLQDKAEELILLANQAGGKDNITVVLGQNVLPDPQNRNAPPSRKTRDFTPVPIIQEVEEISEETIEKSPEQSGHKPTKTTLYIKWGIILLALVALVWVGASLGSKIIFKSQSYKDTSSTPTKTIARIPQPIRIDSLLAQALRDSSRLLLLDSTFAEDTFRLTRPILIIDSGIMTKMGVPLVVVASDTLKPSIAVIITNGGVARFSNIKFQGFETAFQIEDNVQLNLEDVQFFSVGTRIKVSGTSGDTLVNQQVRFYSKLLPH